LAGFGPSTVGRISDVRRGMTDNGTNYRSHVFREALVRLRLHHSRTRPYTPRTNGKAERFIQTMLRKWAYAMPYQPSGRRRAALAPWLRRYNLRRPHGGIGGVAPITRLKEAA
jgi:transposase InsO family protein